MQKKPMISSKQQHTADVERQRKETELWRGGERDTEGGTSHSLACLGRRGGAPFPPASGGRNGTNGLAQNYFASSVDTAGADRL